MSQDVPISAASTVFILPHYRAAKATGMAADLTPNASTLTRINSSSAVHLTRRPTSPLSPAQSRPILFGPGCCRRGAKPLHRFSRRVFPGVVPTTVVGSRCSRPLIGAFAAANPGLHLLFARAVTRPQPVAGTPGLAIGLGWVLPQYRTLLSTEHPDRPCTGARHMRHYEELWLMAPRRLSIVHLTSAHSSEQWQFK